MLSVLDGRRPPRPAECSDWLWTIIVQCWSEDSVSRLTAPEVAALLAQPLSTSLARSTVLTINGEAEDFLPQTNTEPRRQDEGTSPPCPGTTKKPQKERVSSIGGRVRRRRVAFPSRDRDEPPSKSQKTSATEADNEVTQVTVDPACEQPEVCYTLENRFCEF